LGEVRRVTVGADEAENKSMFRKNIFDMAIDFYSFPK